MNTLKLTAAALLMAGFASTAQAQDSNVYGTLGVSSYEFDAYGAEAKLGYNFTEYFGVEAQAGFGLIDDKETIGGVEFKTNVSSQFAAFGVARMPLGENFDIFARAGYHTTKVKASGGGASVSDSIDGFAIGAGGMYSWDDVNGVRLEYTYADGESGSGNLDTFTLSYVRNF